MRRAVMVAAAALVVVSALLSWGPWPTPPPDPGPNRAGPELPLAEAATAPPTAPELAPTLDPSAPQSFGEERPEIDPAQLALIRADAQLNDRARQQTLAAQADARWHEAVDQGGYTADDFDPAVRDLFRRILLEPRYAEDGRIEGLVIESMLEDHPLARLGFRAGDRIDRIQGVPLRDPAEIPSLLARLGGHVMFCAERQGLDFCREVVLE